MSPLVPVPYPLLDTVKARKLACYAHTIRKQGSCLEKEIMQGTMPTHGLDGQHQDVDRTPRGRVNENDGGQRWMETLRPWCGQPSDRGRLKNRTEHPHSPWDEVKSLRRHHSAVDAARLETLTVRCRSVMMLGRGATNQRNVTPQVCPQFHSHNDLESVHEKEMIF